MLAINKIRSNHVIDHAAEELKKYLRMMMPEGGDVKIALSPDAKDGFRLGLMDDFGLDTSDAEDLELDDIVYIDCDTEGGIIAGSNPRSVLLAVYEYLRQNGCRWLMPGVDGEYIPMQDIKPVKYRHLASMRYRGWCNEGAEYQQCMLDAIDLAPKLGMNVFMLEFRIPTSYYNRYYNHLHNTENRPVERVTFDTILQWKRECESEIAKRGLQLHDIGHGFTGDPFGIDSSLRPADGDNEKAVPEGSRKYLALVKGERKLRANCPNYTNFCMSNPEAQKLFVDYVVRYAEMHSNVDYLHVWLGDAMNCHCECEECQKKTPSDWYVILLNRIDKLLTEKKLDTRLVFIAYVDNLWAPIEEKIENQSRFTLLFAPISRKYTEPMPETFNYIPTTPYVRNQLKMPTTLEASFSYLDDWKKHWKGSNVAYEYHFWRHQYYDPSGLRIAERVHEDVKVYKKNGVNGIIQDGSQRSFFPNGLAFYAYARTLFDTALCFEDIVKDYFETAYGDNWREYREYLERVAETFDFAYISGQRSENTEIHNYYSPTVARKLKENAEAVTDGGIALIKDNYNHDDRVRTVSVRLLEMHAKYLKLFAKALTLKACADDEAASEAFNRMRIESGKWEAEFEPYFDHTLIIYSFENLFKTRSQSDAPIYRLDN